MPDITHWLEVKEIFPLTYSNVTFFWYIFFCLKEFEGFPQSEVNTPTSPLPTCTHLNLVTAVLFHTLKKTSQDQNIALRLNIFITVQHQKTQRQILGDQVYIK